MRRALAAFAAMLPAAALACGVCIEDRVAATYDHAVIVRAQAEHRVVVFASIDGFGDARALARTAERAAANVRGIDRRSVRSAFEPGAALSFALDPALADPPAALAAIERGAPGKGLKLELLRVVAPPATR
jgi:hypothetical protein